MTNGGGFLDEEDTSTKLKKYLGGIAGFLLFFAISYYVRGHWRDFIHPHWTAESIAADVRRDPKAAEMVDAMQLYYPDDAQAMLQQLADDANRGDETVSNQNMFNFARRFMARKRDAMLRAPASLLHQLASESSAFVHVLRNDDPALCARFFMQGLSVTDHPSPNAGEHLTRLTVLQIEAAHAGEAGGTVRPPLSEQDRSAMARAIRDNDPSIVPLIADQHALFTAPAERQCAAAIAFYDAAAELPEQASANVFADVMRSAPAN